MSRIGYSLVVLALAQACAPFATAKRPNIVIIMADDMGFSDLGCYGSEIATPNLDRLAAGGLRFTQFYNTARCCPTRAAPLTGLYPHQAGVGHMVEDLGAPAYQGYLNDRSVTIAEVLRTAGYRTLMSGKWHVGSERPHWPRDRGFDRYYGLIDGGSNYFRIDAPRRLVRDDDVISPTGEGYYITDAFTDAAVEMLAEHKDSAQPFFLYLAYTAPHWPLHAPPEDIAKYRGKYLGGWDELRRTRHAKLIELGLVDADWPLTPRDDEAPAWNEVDDPEARDLKMAVYAAQIDRLDQNIGRVLDQLRTMGADRNTLVMFLADNGGCAEEIDRGKPGVPPGGAESFLSYGLPWANASNTPFRRYKHWVHEGGISTPLIVSWPEVITESSITSAPGHVIDLMATCIDVGGAEYPETYRGRAVTPLEGKSLAPIFRGDERPRHEAIFWEHEGNRAVRVGKWKLVSRHGRPWELFDLAADRTELNDVAAKHPDKVADLQARYDSWSARAGVRDWNDLRRQASQRNSPRFQGKTASTWQGELGAADPLMRQSAVKALGVLNAKTALRGALDHEDSTVRYWAAVELANQQQLLEPALSDLARRLDDEAPTVRIAAAEAICRHQANDDEALAVIVDALNHEEGGVRLAAMTALGAMGTGAEPALGAIRSALNDENQYVVRVAKRILAELEPMAAGN